MSAPRIALIAHSDYPSEPRTRRMAEALAGAGCQVEVICLRLPGRAAEEEIDGVQVTRLPIAHQQGAGAVVICLTKSSYNAGLASLPILLAAIVASTTIRLFKISA